MQPYFMSIILFYLSCSGDGDDHNENMYNLIFVHTTSTLFSPSQSHCVFRPVKAELEGKKTLFVSEIEIIVFSLA